MRHTTHALLLVGALLAATAASAANTNGGCPDEGDQKRPKGPPPEAVAACAGKSVGATVTVTMKDGRTMTGVCEQQGNVLAARPQGMGGPQGGGHGGPPPDGGRGAPPDGAASAPPPPPRCGQGGSSANGTSK